MRIALIALLALGCTAKVETQWTMPRLVLHGAAGLDAVDLHVRDAGLASIENGHLALDCPCDEKTVDLVLRADVPKSAVLLVLGRSGGVVTRRFVGSLPAGAGPMDVTLAPVGCADADGDGLCTTDAAADCDDADAAAPLERACEAQVDDVGTDTAIDDVGQDVPKVEEDLPKVEDDVPEVSDDVPEVSDDVPEVSDDVPEVSDDVPEVADDGGAPCVPGGAELCDGLDNDCDGDIDEDFPAKGEACSAGEGACAGDGTQECSQDLLGLTCSAEAAPDGATCDDGDACTTEDRCDGGVCQGTNTCCASNDECDDANQCTLDACNAAKACVHSNTPDGAACDDGSACTANDGCLSGACKGTPAVDCTDANPCTDDACDPASGECTHVSNTASCDDGNVCTSGDACGSGACAGLAVDDGTSCDDGDKCTAFDACAAGACGGVAIDVATACDDGSACTVDMCVSTVGCVQKDRVFESAISVGQFKAYNRALVALSDGFALVGDTRAVDGGSPDALLVRSDSVGEVIWERTYGGPASDNAVDLVVISGEGFAFAGTTGSSGGPRAWLVRTDGLGDVVWEQAYGPSGSASAKKLAVVPDDGFAILAQNDFGAWLIRTDATGAMIWDHTYEAASAQTACALAYLPDGGFAVAGRSEQSGGGTLDVILVRTDAGGETLWERTYDSAGTDAVYDLAPLDDGGFAMAIEVNNGVSAWLVRTDPNGTLLWTRSFDSALGYRTPRALVALSDGGFAIAGQASQSGLGAWLLRTDSDGNSLWERIQQAAGGIAYALAALPDGDFALSGQVGNAAFWLIRTDPWGHASCDDAGVCADTAPETCDDEDPCTADLCDPTLGCVHGPPACAIGGTCYPAGAVNPDNACGTCDPAKAPGAWMGCPSGSACDDSGQCALAGFAAIPAGTFTMGSPVTEVGRDDDETQHEVTVSRPMWVQLTEVTQAEWQSLMGNAPSTHLGCPTCPVETVSWWDAIAYCNALSVQEGLSPCYATSGCTGTPGDGAYACATIAFEGPGCAGYRLPTESEWERAARAGTTGATYNGELDAAQQSCQSPNLALDPIGWFCGNAQGSSQGVGLKTANGYGLFDMLGNVWEWCWDWKAEYGASGSDPSGPSSGDLRVVRGGAWSFEAHEARSGSRDNGAPSYRDNYLGFRAARTIVAACIPQCAGKLCGPDGCGGACGTCPSGVACDVAGQCPLAGYASIPAGTFTMGSPVSEPGHVSNEAEHPVTITSPYWLKTTEVTQAEWQALMGNNPSISSCGASCPVESVNWWDAVAYCNQLSVAEGLSACYTVTGCTGTPGDGEYLCTGVAFAGLGCSGYRLPTEAEWEHAARAKTTGATYNGTLDSSHLGCEQPNSVLDPIGWFCGNAGNSTHPVAQKQKNAYGLYDTAGNVWEWCGDWSAAYAGSAIDPTGPMTGTHRVVRGGRYGSYARNLRSAFRNESSPDYRNYDQGFRPARSIVPEYAVIPAGTFTMGAPATEPGHQTYETAHPVTISKPFILKTTEVTRAEWQTLMGNTPSQNGGCGATCPVEQVSWWDTLAYCNALSAKEGFEPCYALSGCTGVPGDGAYACTGVTFSGTGCAGYRLPTEAEWEVGARGGTTGGTYNGTSDAEHLACEAPNAVLDPIAWFCGNATSKSPVAQKKPNAFGLYDMLGNVFEWCWDGWGAFSDAPVTDPTGPADPVMERVFRGGAWKYGGGEARAARRQADVPTSHYPSVGFRPARTLDP